MKVELDLSTEQLQKLDDNLTNLLDNLTEEQRIEIIKSYINFQFDKLTYTYKTSWGNEQKELSKFGKDLVTGLQDLITKSISTEILEHENIKEIIEANIKEVENNIYNIISSAISRYIIDNLFTSRIFAFPSGN